MVMYTGLWRFNRSCISGGWGNACDDEDNHRGNDDSTRNSGPRPRPDDGAVEYGYEYGPSYGACEPSVDDQATKTHHDGENDSDGGDDGYGGTSPGRRSASVDADADADAFSTTTSSSPTEVPSLTAAFQSIDNRPMVINCLRYLAIYMSLAVVAYSYVFERWTVIDSLYFAVATFTTCGYGDLQPTTTQGQLFTIIFAIYGVIILGVFIGIFGSFISEAQTKAMKKFQRKKQHQMIKTLFVTNDSNEEENNDKVGCNSTIDIEQTGFWRDHVSLADDIWKVVMAEFPLIGLVAIMALILGIREGWDVTSTLYFCVMAATTTGYGDYTPTNQLDKLYCVILLPLAVAVFGEVLGRIATIYIQRKQRMAELKFVHRSLTLCDIRNMDTNDDGKVDREEFILFMLVALQKVDKTTIEELKGVFDKLDTNGNGLLEEEDLMELAEENYLPTLGAIRKELTLSSTNMPLMMNMLYPPTSSSALSSSAETIQQRQHGHRRAHTVL